MSLQSVKNELKELKKEVSPNYKPIEVLLKSDLNSLSDYELYRLARYENEPELTEHEFNNLSDDELLKIINGEYLELAAIKKAN